MIHIMVNITIIILNKLNAQTFGVQFKRKNIENVTILNKILGNNTCKAFEHLPVWETKVIIFSMIFIFSVFFWKTFNAKKLTMKNEWCG